MQIHSVCTAHATFTGPCAVLEVFHSALKKITFSFFPTPTRAALVNRPISRDKDSQSLTIQIRELKSDDHSIKFNLQPASLLSSESLAQPAERQTGKMTSGKMPTALCVLIALVLVEIAESHSFMTYPQGSGSGECRVGGLAPVLNCKGPCDFSRIEGERANDP